MSTAVRSAGVEARRSTRSGAIGLLGAVVNGARGFVLTAVIVRVFGPAEAGAFFAVVGLVTIARSLCCLGTDSGLVWALPRRMLGATGAPVLATALLDGGPRRHHPDQARLRGRPGRRGRHGSACRSPCHPPGQLVRRPQPGRRADRPPAAHQCGGALRSSVVLGFAGWLLPLAAAAVAAALLLIGPLGLAGGATLRPTPGDRRLLSGNSRGHLLAAGCGLVLNVTLCALLIPRHGALGAAIAWSVGIVGENTIAAILARRTLGEPIFGRALVGAATAAAAATGLAAAAGALLGGRGLPGLGIAPGLLTLAALASLSNGRVRQALHSVRAQLRPAATQEVSG